MTKIKIKSTDHQIICCMIKEYCKEVVTWLTTEEANRDVAQLASYDLGKTILHVSCTKSDRFHASS